MNRQKKFCPIVSIIILNWNGWKDTIECLESLYRVVYPNFNIIVVDNGSVDDSVEKIKEWTKRNDETQYKKDNENKLIIIRNDRNYGFAEGNNVGIRFALKELHPDYILILNNDTVADKNFLSELIKVSESDDKIGAIGPKIYYYDFNGRKDVIWFAGGTIDWKNYPGYFHLRDGLVDLVDDSIAECDWITGTALMLKIREIPIKFLDTNFFFGCEDIDICIRLQKLGYKIVINPNAKIWHKIGASRIKRGKSLMMTLKDIRTNFKFLKIHSTNYYLYLPLYIGKLFNKSILYRNKK